MQRSWGKKEKVKTSAASSLTRRQATRDEAEIATEAMIMKDNEHHAKEIGLELCPKDNEGHLGKLCIIKH